MASSTEPKLQPSTSADVDLSTERSPKIESVQDGAVDPAPEADLSAASLSNSVAVKRRGRNAEPPSIRTASSASKPVLDLDTPPNERSSRQQVIARVGGYESSTILDKLVSFVAGLVKRAENALLKRVAPPEEEEQQPPLAKQLHVEEEEEEEERKSHFQSPRSIHPGSIHEGDFKPGSLSPEKRNDS